ncbi:heparinase II/III domain-containing protein [Paenibacillus cymbidii]|uniref:heparinase II/III domain-containing protein n=1 Tax=Paenibacillus cymbidii TaxID=1639034 RepID=UPI001436B301|nr:heparinase II/III family protein [Paenibacillus cymbidii]
MRWDVAVRQKTNVPMPAKPAAAKAVGLPITSNLASMQFVDVCLECPDRENSFRTSIVIEWKGERTVHLLLPSGKEPELTDRKQLWEHRYAVAGAPSIDKLTAIALVAGYATFPGTVLEIGEAEWLERIPPIRVNEAEDLLETFMNPRLWDVSEWKYVGDDQPKPAEAGLNVSWLDAQIWYVEQADGIRRLAFEKTYDQDIGDYQALIVSIAADRRASFRIFVQVDGRTETPFGDRAGIGGGEEVRIPLSGKRLERIRVEVSGVPERHGTSVGERIVTVLRWIMLERRGAAPDACDERLSLAPIAPAPQRPEDADMFPLALLFGAEERDRLRRDVAASPVYQRFYRDLLTEAETNLRYSPEEHVGAYLPVFWNNLGIDRVSKQWQDTAKWHSTLTVNAMAFALGGDERHGEAARRALLAIVRCGHWAPGFVNRVPAGIRGYRAPFIEAHTAMTVAVCYDLVYGLLAVPERREVEEAMYDKAIPWIDSYFHQHGEGYLLRSNQGAVYALGMIYASLVASRRYPHAIEYFHKTVVWLGRMMEAYFAADGSTNEGISYLEYTLHHLLEALHVAARHLGVPAASLATGGIARTPAYLLQMQSLGERTLDFLPIGDKTVAGVPNMGPSLLFFARHFRDGDARWLWNRYFNDERMPYSSFFAAHPFDGPFQSTGCYATSPLTTMLWYEDGEAEKPALAPQTFMESCGRTFIRTGTEYGDKLLFFEGGAQTFEHTHYDKGQFIMEAYGVPFAADPGMIAYLNPAHLEYKGSSYHNVATIGKRNQSYRDPARAVVIRRRSGDARHDYLSADLSGAYREMKRYDRKLLFVRPDYFLVMDEIVALEDGIVWNFHSRATFVDRSADSGNLPPSPTGRLVLDAPEAGMVMAYGSNCALSVSFGDYRDQDIVTCRNARLQPPPTARQFGFAAVMVPYPKNGQAAMPEVQTERAGDTVIFVVKGDWGVDRIECAFALVSEAGDASFIRVERNGGDGNGNGETTFELRG